MTQKWKRASPSHSASWLQVPSHRRGRQHGGSASGHHCGWSASEGGSSELVGREACAFVVVVVVVVAAAVVILVVAIKRTLQILETPLVSNARQHDRFELKSQRGLSGFLDNNSKEAFRCSHPSQPEQGDAKKDRTPSPLCLWLPALIAMP